MNEFASAAMVRLLSAGMSRQGMLVPAFDARGAHVSLDTKRALVAAAVAQGGLVGLVDLGRGIEHIAGDATYQALAPARHPQDLLARWNRLERYVHSDHRVRVAEAGPRHLVLVHEARRAGARPWPAESLVVLGVIVAALELIGVVGLQARVDGVRLHPDGPDRPDRSWQPQEAGGSLQTWQTWQLDWAEVAERPAARPQPARAALAAPIDLCDPLPWSDAAHAVARHLLADLAAPARLDEAARAAACAPRTLQAMLQRAGLSFTTVVSEARTRAAAWWLAQTPRSIAEVGFLCGFADQPHFTREFSRRVGVTPAKYRQAFGA